MRLFVAVWPSDEVAGVLRAFDRPAIGGVRWTKEPQWHVTLRFLGSVPESDVDALGEAIASAAGGCSRRSVTMGPATGCFGRGILMVPVAGLEDLATATVGSTSSFGEPPDDRPFAGHITLARSRGIDLRRFSAMPLAAAWQVDEVTLVRSTTASDGPHYEVIGRCPLA